MEQKYSKFRAYWTNIIQYLDLFIFSNSSSQPSNLPFLAAFSKPQASDKDTLKEVQQVQGNFLGNLFWMIGNWKSKRQQVESPTFWSSYLVDFCLNPWTAFWMVWIADSQAKSMWNQVSTKSETNGEACQLVWVSVKNMLLQHYPKLTAKNGQVLLCLLEIIDVEKLQSIKGRCEDMQLFHVFFVALNLSQ